MSDKSSPATWQEGVEWTEQRHLESLAATIAAGLVSTLAYALSYPLEEEHQQKVADDALSIADQIIRQSRN